MPSGRASDRERRRRRGDGPVARRAERVRRGVAETAGRRPGGQNPPRPRPKSSTGGAFKLSSTRRAAVLALLVCAMALSVSVPLRTYLSQREELSAQQKQQVDLTRQVSELEQRKSELSDPAHIEAEARARLGYVRPGETPYIVEVPPTSAQPPPPSEQAAEDTPWYERLWNSLTGAGS